MYAPASISTRTVQLAVPTSPSRHRFWALCPPTFLSWSHPIVPLLFSVPQYLFPLIQYLIQSFDAPVVIPVLFPGHWPAHFCVPDVRPHYTLRILRGTDFDVRYP